MRRLALFAAAILFSLPAFAAEGGKVTVEKKPLYTGAAIGEIKHYTAKYEDTMVKLSRANDLGFIALHTANPGVDAWLPGAGTDIILPEMSILPDAPRKGIVINLPEMHLYYYPYEGAKPLRFPIGIGRLGLQTPVGTTYVRAKEENPSWRPTPRMLAEDPTLPDFMPGGPDNPEGARVMYLGWQEYGIHGTNKPYGIGRRSSSGCIRLYPEDILKLYPLVPVGTTVTVVNQPVKAAWIGNEFYVEADLTMAQADKVENDEGPPDYEMSDDDMRAIMKAAGAGEAEHLDWAKIRQVVSERRGYPVAAGVRSGT